MNDFEKYLASVKQRTECATDFTHGDFPDEAFELLKTDLPRLVEMVEYLYSMATVSYSAEELDKGLNKIARDEK